MRDEHVSGELRTLNVTKLQRILKRDYVRVSVGRVDVEKRLSSSFDENRLGFFGRE